MPLPPALAAKLAKRGLVDGTSVKTPLEKKQRIEAEEEVIAENYDSNMKNSRPIVTFSQDDMSSQVEKQFRGHIGCPNKWNIYHECSSYCVKHWGKGTLVPDQKYLKRQARLLLKYPLPNSWKDVYDPGTGRHYYWETTSDMVSWLPPGHPKAVVSESAATIREERHLAATDASDHESEEEDDEEEVPEKRDADIIKEAAPVLVKKSLREETRMKLKNNDLDPMDPAAYSDAPRGRWSDGLEKCNEAKTGADVTAAGPLYQMRPYPAPGAVLRANAANKPKD